MFASVYLVQIHSSNEWKINENHDDDDRVRV